MEINYNNHIIRQFREINQGECFVCFGESYIKIRPMEDCDGEVIANAVCLEDGEPKFVNDDRDVSKCEALVTVRY